MAADPLSLMKNMIVMKPVNFDTHLILMQAFTWHREKHSLFDTEAKEDKLSKKSEKVSECLNISRKDKEIFALNYSVEEFDNSHQHLLRVQ